jgi:hypothetical protein
MREQRAAARCAMLPLLAIIAITILLPFRHYASSRFHYFPPPFSLMIFIISRQPFFRLRHIFAAFFFHAFIDAAAIDIIFHIPLISCHAISLIADDFFFRARFSRRFLSISLFR